MTNEQREIFVTLIFEDWHRDGVSVYNDPIGVELSMGDLHSGTSWDITLSLPQEIINTIARAAEHGVYPLCRIITK